MEGDLVRHFLLGGKFVGPIHLANNPGRGAVDAPRKIDYRLILRAIAISGCQSYTGQAMIPRGNDKLARLGSRGAALRAGARALPIHLIRELETQAWRAPLQHVF